MEWGDIEQYFGPTDVHLVGTPAQNTDDPDWTDYTDEGQSSNPWLSYKTDIAKQARMKCHCEYEGPASGIKVLLEHDADGGKHDDNKAYFLDWDNNIWTAYLVQPLPQAVMLGRNSSEIRTATASNVCEPRH